MLEREAVIRLDSLEETGRVGRMLGGVLPGRTVGLFFGGMGAGKTTLIKSVCEGLGVHPENVISPTYTIVNLYPGGRGPIFHVDLFRMESPEALLEMDPADWINPEGVTLIEWPERGLPLLEGHPLLELHLAGGPGRPEARELRLRSADPLYDTLFDALETFQVEPPPE